MLSAIKTKTVRMQMVMHFSIVLIVVAMTIYTCGAMYVMVKQDMSELVSCADSGGIKFPFADKLCKAYLWHFRGSANDIRELEFNGGADHVLLGAAPFVEREALLKHLIDKGLDVNHKSEMNGWGLTPLHGSVIERNASKLLLLLHLGARIDIKDDHFKLTPLELAQHLQQTSKYPADFKRMEELLKQNSK
jgi:hypothetical protein